MRWLPLLLLVACDPVIPTPDDTDSDLDSDSDTEPLPVPFADLAPGEWSYLALDGMLCGNGTATGIGVNPGTDPTQVHVFYAGGGACWDAATCHVLKSAVNLETGWGEGKMTAETRGLDNSGLFDRSDVDNPYRSATFVYVPYCTGDLHAGTTERTYFAPAGVVHHHGDANTQAVVEHLVDELPGVEQVWLTGVSAGGYGVQFQVDRYAAAWPDAELAALADCSPMVTPYGDRFGAFRAAWNPRLPDDCAGCDRSLTALLQTQLAAMPDARFGLTAYDNDGTITLYLGYPIGGLQGATVALVDDTYVPAANASAFLVVGNQHTMLGNVGAVTGPGGVRLEDWFWGWANGDEDFVDVR
jgi:hypothetical protein